MFKLKILSWILVFLAGFVTAGILFLAQSASATGSVVAYDQYSPQNHVTEDQILVYKDRVVLDVPDVKWASIADTNSMDPFFDSGANVLQIIPQFPSDIAVGDVVSYSPQGSPAKHIIHRVVYIGEDEEGLYFILKGDNNAVSDPGKVRFEQIDRVLIGVIY
ncbi:hypothetical protein JXA48_00475 [Candidatus Woesearchaeota archaeon]|nr:hypothetical protein [Candidatus Woesearchaeota archaeon]